MKVNILEFQGKYMNLIPEDIMAQFSQCFGNGESEAEVRDTIYEEMKIKAFYNEHPELAPKTDWEITSLFSFLTDLMASVIKNEGQTSEKAQELIRRAGIILDRFKVENRPTAELEYIYETALWLKTEIIDEQSKSI